MKQWIASTLNFLKILGKLDALVSINYGTFGLLANFDVWTTELLCVLKIYVFEEIFI